MTRVVTLADQSTMTDWSWQVWTLILVLLLASAFAVEWHRNARRTGHVHYFSDADGACQSPGCTVVRRNRRSTP